MACSTGKKSLEGVYVCEEGAWRAEERGIEYGGIENWAVVMDAMQGSGTLGLSVIKGLLFSQHKHTHTHVSSLTRGQTQVWNQLFHGRRYSVHCT